jgi:DNA-binding CsgD family transcriptional regulator
MNLIAPPTKSNISAHDPSLENPNQVELLDSAIASAGFGLMLVTAHRRIIWANRSAMGLIRENSELLCENGRISASDFKIARKLQSAISGTPTADESLRGGSILLRNEDGLASLVMHVVPIGPPITVWPYSERPIAGLILAACQSGTDARVNVFVDLFDLTSAEARVLAHLVLGKGLPEVAKQLKIAPCTARSHLDNIFQKTGTNRQAELVRVFFETTIPLKRYPSALSQRFGLAASPAIR